MPAGKDQEVLTALDQIRQAEAEITRKIAAARQEAEQAVDDAQRRAGIMKQEAREAGIHEGQLRYKEIVSRAEEESGAIVAEAQKRAQELRRKGQQRAKAGLEHAVRLVIGLNREASDER